MACGVLWPALWAVLGGWSPLFIAAVPVGKAAVPVRLVPVERPSILRTFMLFGCILLCYFPPRYHIFKDCGSYCRVRGLAGSRFVIITHTALLAPHHALSFNAIHSLSETRNTLRPCQQRQLETCRGALAIPWFRWLPILQDQGLDRLRSAAPREPLLDGSLAHLAE